MDEDELIESVIDLVEGNAATAADGITILMAAMVEVARASLPEDKDPAEGIRTLLTATSMMCEELFGITYRKDLVSAHIHAPGFAKLTRSDGRAEIVAIDQSLPLDDAMMKLVQEFADGK